MVGLLALVAWAPTAVVQAQAELVVLDVSVAQPAADGDTPVPLVDAAALRLELARTMHALVVASESAEAFEVPPVASISIALSPGHALIAIHMAATADRPASDQSLAFEGELNQARLVALLLALVGPSVNMPSSSGMDVRVNPYRDATPPRTRPEPLRPRMAMTFLVPNPYRGRHAVRLQPPRPMALSENPYR
jgi:hypothetical protein